jgi:hypothetical protein
MAAESIGAPRSQEAALSEAELRSVEGAAMFPTAAAAEEAAGKID